MNIRGEAVFWPTRGNHGGRWRKTAVEITLTLNTEMCSDVKNQLTDLSEIIPFRNAVGLLR